MGHSARLLHLRQIFCGLDYLFKDLMALLLMQDLTAAKKHCELHFVTFLQKFPTVIDFDFIKGLRGIYRRKPLSETIQNLTLNNSFIKGNFSRKSLAIAVAISIDPSGARTEKISLKPGIPATGIQAVFREVQIPPFLGKFRIAVRPVAEKVVKKNHDAGQGRQVGAD